MTTKGPSFGKWRTRLWPVQPFELKKLLPLFFIKFFISFNFGILGSIKDTVIVTEKSSGAEVIPMLKGWIVLPISLVASLIFAKLSNHLKRSTIFNLIIIAFLFIIAIYGFVLYPYKEFFSPHQSADWLLEHLGEKYQYWIAIYRHWPQTLFFVTAELWGSIVIFLLFWGLANQINKIHEAKRFYTLFSAAGNTAAISTGPLVWYYTSKFMHINYLYTLQTLIIFVLFFGFIILCLHKWLEKYVLQEESSSSEQQDNQKIPLSLKEGFKYVIKSKYLRPIAIMVIGYGLTMNLIEVTWKANLKLYYPNPADYQSFMGMITSCVGVISFFISLFLGGNVLRFFGWRFSALIPPIIVGSTGIVFLGLVLLKTHLPSATLFGLSPLLLVVLFGAFQNISSKAVKYSFFDPTKEMAFIPVDNETKVKGKTAIDIVGSRLGKSGAAWIQIILIEIFSSAGSVLSITPYLFPIVAFSMIRWVFAVRNLNEQFQPKTNNVFQTKKEVLPT